MSIAVSIGIRAELIQARLTHAVRHGMTDAQAEDTLRVFFDLMAAVDEITPPAPLDTAPPLDLAAIRRNGGPRPVLRVVS